MSEPPANPGTGEDPELARRSAPRAPRWVKLAALVAVVLVLLFVAVLVAGDGDHGPGRHARGDNPSTAPPSPAGPADGHTRPSSMPDHRRP